MLDLVITNGSVVFPREGVKEVDLGVKDGKIVGIYAPGTSLEAQKTIDAKGKHIFPGVIDAHQHLGIYNSVADDFADTIVHAVGGVTTVVNYYREPKTYYEVMPRLIEEAEANSYIDFAFTLGILTQEHMRELEGYVKEFGLTSFKFFRNYERNVNTVFKTEDGIGLSSADLVTILTRFKEISPKMLLAVHCENMDIARHLTADLKKQEVADTLETWNLTSPGYAEAESLLSTLYINEKVGGNVFLVHLSSGDSVLALENVPWLRERGMKVETCIHYLTLTTESDCGLRAKVGPPIHHQWDQDLLWEGIEKGLINAIGTDHCPSDLKRKFAKGEGVWDTLFGFPGVGALLPAMISEGYHKRGLSLERIADITSLQLAESFNLPEKGRIEIGADADFAIVDLNLEQTIEPSMFHSASDYSVYDGLTMKGWPVISISRGDVLVENGTPKVKEARGKYIHRSI